jgi:hypothetical protein
MSLGEVGAELYLHTQKFGAISNMFASVNLCVLLLEPMMPFKR